MAAVPRNDPLRSEATRLRIEARLREAGPALAREAAELSESELGDRPTSRDLPVRAQAYAAGGEPAVALETVALLLNQLGREPGAHADLARGAGELALAMPAQGELRRARADTLRRLGL